MKQEAKAVFGLYRTRSQAEHVVNTLRANKIHIIDISMLLPEDLAGPDHFHIKASKAPEGIFDGGSTGTVLGGTLGLLCGIGSITIPGIGPFIAAGPLLTTFAGFGEDATAGSVKGALADHGISESDAAKYEDSVKTGGVIIAVHAVDAAVAARARLVLENTGAQFVIQSAEPKAIHEPVKSRIDQPAAELF